MFAVVLLIFLVVHSTWASLVVNLPDGKIQGEEIDTINGVSFNAYRGIPFAAPPLGKLRFKAPVHPKKWKHVLNATKDAPTCVSRYYNETTSDESEDCLYLNVYTPVKCGSSRKEKLPVMLWIYGGGFIEGGSKLSWWGPDFLIEKDVILVTSNYRLGAFGFLSTGDRVLPGNVGLKDQLMVLKWIHRNIGRFGGDPEKVTVFGQSSGAQSACLHALSPRSNGLLRGAICQSGSALTRWIKTNPKKHACDLLKAIRDTVPSSRFSYSSSSSSSSSSANGSCSSQEVLDAVKALTAQQIMDAGRKIGADDYTEVYLPVLEPAGKDAFLSWNDGIYSAIKSGRINNVTLIIGMTSEEYMGLIDPSNFFNETVRTYDNDNQLLIPTDLNISSEEDRAAALREIRKLYLHENSTFEEKPAALVRYFTDNEFTRGIRKDAELRSRFNNIYFYQYSYDGQIRYFEKIPVEGVDGVGHSAELPYLFSQKFTGFDNTNLSNYSAGDLLNHDRLIKLWTDFAKTLNPTPEKSDLLQNVIWPKLQPNSFHYLDIGNNIQIKSNVKEERYQKWLRIYEKYAEEPIITY